MLQTIQKPQDLHSCKYDDFCSLFNVGKNQRCDTLPFKTETEEVVSRSATKITEIIRFKNRFSGSGYLYQELQIVLEASGFAKILCGVLVKKKLKEIMYRCTCRREITEITLKTALKNHTINQSCSGNILAALDVQDVTMVTDLRYG